MTVEWNHEQIKNCIDLYKQKSELWDRKDNNYHIKSKKNDAWLDIAGTIGCDVTVAKSKIASLLSSYRREKGKIKKISMDTGKGRHKIWFAFKYFDFLKQKDTPKATIKTENISDEEHLQDHSTQSYEHEMNDGPVNRESSEPASENEGENSSKRKQFISPSKPTKKRKLDEESMLTRAYNILESVSNVLRDECSTFGEYLGTKLQKFNDQRRAILMNNINNLVFEAEMELYSHQQFNQCRNVDYRSPTISTATVVSDQCSPAVPEYDTRNQVAHSSGLRQPREPSS